MPGGPASASWSCDCAIRMPTVAIVEAVKIQFFAREHPPPHFHAVFAEYRV